jgi:hypothetical protein
VPRHEFQALQQDHRRLSRDLKELRTTLNSNDNWPAYARSKIGEPVSIVTASGARCIGILLWIDRYNLGLDLLRPYYRAGADSGGGPADFQTGDEVVLAKGDVSVIGPWRDDNGESRG